jgi:hypothetical protein
LGQRKNEPCCTKGRDTEREQRYYAHEISTVLRWFVPMRVVAVKKLSEKPIRLPYCDTMYDSHDEADQQRDGWSSDGDHGRLAVTLRADTIGMLTAV